MVSYLSYLSYLAPEDCANRFALIAPMSADSTIDRRQPALPMPATQCRYCHAQLCRRLAN